MNVLCVCELLPKGGDKGVHSTVFLEFGSRYLLS